MSWFVCLSFCLLLTIDKSVLAADDVSPDPEYLITLPQALIINKEYSFYVDSAGSLARIALTTTELLSNLTVKEEEVTFENGFGEMKYSIPFDNIPGEFVRLNFRIELCRLSNSPTKMFKDCNFDNTDDYKVYNRTVRLKVIKNNFLVLAETNKPIYKPGELVQFRFITVSGNNLQLNSKDSPKKYKILKSDETSDYRLSAQKLSQNEEEKFSIIYIEDNSKTRLKQWEKVSWRQALNLSFQLSQDPAFGDYKIVANYKGQKTMQKFTVKKYVLPKFSVSIKPPRNVFIKDKSISYSVCATYTNGRSMEGTIESKLCIKPSYGYYRNNKVRPCITKTIQMNSGTACYKITSSTKALELRNREYPNWNAVTEVEASVTESGTSETIKKSVKGGELVKQKFNIEFLSSAYYKPGLPHRIEIKATKYDLRPQSNTQIKLSAQSYPDYFTLYRSNSSLDNSWGFTEYVTTDENGYASITIPPIRINRGISFQAEDPNFIQNESNDKIVKEQSSYISQGISSWSSKSEVYMRIVEQKAISKSSKCSTLMSINMEANTQLNDKTLYAQVFSRGELVQGESYGPLKREETCTDQDGASGHYSCVKQDDGEYLLKCKPGWTGNDCTTPICVRSCNYGVCIKPNECSCKGDWTGDNCNKCLLSSECKNGYCKRGGDCICEEGWRGYWCDKKVTNGTEQRYGSVGHRNRYEDASLEFYENEENETLTIEEEPELQKRTIYARSIQLSLTKMSLPEAVILVYFKVPMENSSNVIAESLKLGDILPSECVTTDPESVFQFDRSASAPGENVTLQFDTKRDNNTCGLSARDVALETFQDSSDPQISIEGVIDALIMINNKIKQVYDNPMKKLIRDFCGDDNYPYPPIYQRPIPLRSKRSVYYPNYVSGSDSAKLFSDVGVVSLTNSEMFSRECKRGYLMAYQGRAEQFSEVADSAPMPMAKGGGPKNEDKQKKTLEARVRQFFPESWLFDVLQDPPKQIQLTVPDSLTTWKASAFCFTDQGLWIPPTTSLKVTMPFNLQLSLPYSVKRNEILTMPVKVFSNLNNCFQVELFLQNQSDLKIIGDKRYTSCFCNNQQKTFYFQLLATKIGRVDIVASAYAKYSSLCQKEDGQVDQIDLPSDAVKRKLLVVPEGIPQEMNLINLVCLENNETQSFSTNTQMPEAIVDGSVRNYVIFGGDVMGPSLTNLDGLVRMPYGCGEQNMVSMVPSISFLDYITAAKINNSQISQKAKTFIGIGYNRQLKYRRDDGSYSAFGNRDAAGSTWLTAFVYKSFRDAQKYSSEIDDLVLRDALKYLQSKQNEEGCFREDGKVFSSTMKGGIGKGKNKEILLTAYIVASLVNSQKSPARDMRMKGLSCLKNYLQTDSEKTISDLNNYSLALITYTLSLYQPNDAFTTSLQNTLKTRAIRNVVSKYWSDDADNKKKDLNRYWITGTSSEVETTAYAYLALKNVDPIGESMFAIRWLTTQRNAEGGFYSTQDTVVGLKAISDFAKDIAVGSASSISVSASNQKKSINNVRINETNKLVSNRFDFTRSDNPGLEISWNLRGSGCVYMQSTTMFNVPSPATIDSPFSLITKVSKLGNDCKRSVVTTCFTYRDSSNMILLKINSVSGWQAESKEKQLLKKYSQIGLKRVDFDQESTSFYFDEIELEDDSLRCVAVSFTQMIEVKNSEPSQISIFDYYSPEISVDEMYSLEGCESNDSNNETSSTNINNNNQNSTQTCPSQCSADEIDVSKISSFICSDDSRILLLSDSDSANKKKSFHLSKKDVYLGSWSGRLRMKEECDCYSQMSTSPNWVIFTKRNLYTGEDIDVTEDMMVMSANKLQSILSTSLFCQAGGFTSRLVENKLQIRALSSCPKYLSNYDPSLQSSLQSSICSGRNYFISNDNSTDLQFDFITEETAELSNVQFLNAECRIPRFFDENNVVMASTATASSQENEDVKLNSEFVLMSGETFQMYYQTCSLSN